MAQKTSLGAAAVKFGKAVSRAERNAHKVMNEAATTIGRTVGRAERKGRKVVDAAAIAREELAALAKKAEVLARDLKRTSQRVRRALD
jgi:cell division septum initiation protein DivIVA